MGKDGYHDGAGCIGSYQIDGEPLSVDLPPGSYWWRNHRRHFKIYAEDVSLGEKAAADLKRIPEGKSRAVVRPDNHGDRYVYYEVSWF